MTFGRKYVFSCRANLKYDLRAVLHKLLTQSPVFVTFYAIYMYLFKLL